MSVTVRDLRTFKERGERFVMLTAYDYPTARILDEAGVPALLVGDSLANNILGYENTLPVTMEEMLHHTRAVARGAKNALIVGDMPFLSYQTSLEEGIRNAGRFLKEGGAHAVKLEGAMLELTGALVERGIPVMGHIGLTPQSVHAMGGYRVQGRSEEDARRLLDQAHALEKSGIFSLVLEGIPAPLAAQITDSLSVPTIGIGAGSHCDGQVLVITDLLGLGYGTYPKFVKPYADLRGEITRAVQTFRDEVAAGVFPDDAHSYH
ncbi:MAG TPA: 3-methyl-2-oxobutanoate hydroxymethyltransferase [Actinomycetota bacterium]|nr:3-methyl-2-oxobutanoate hydroxymethyltransferase [Actinomycetota bacterium]